MNRETSLLSGRWGSWVYYVRKGKQFRRRYVVTKDPRTPAQLRARAAFGAASHYWSHTLEITDQERDAWEAAANQHQSRPRASQSGLLTGQQYYVGLACAKPAQRRSRQRQLRAPTRSGDGSSPLPALHVGPPPDCGDKLSPPRRRLQRLPRTGTTWELREICAGPTRTAPRVVSLRVFRAGDVSSTQARCVPHVGPAQISRSSDVVPARLPGLGPLYPEGIAPERAAKRHRRRESHSARPCRMITGPACLGPGPCSRAAGRPRRRPVWCWGYSTSPSPPSGP